MTPGLNLTTILYAGGLAVVSAAMLSLLPALRATRARLQSHLANLGTGGATLRFGCVWTSVMIAQVALTAIGIPAAIESASEAMRTVRIRAEFPSREYLAARIDLHRPSDEEATSSAFGERRAQTYAELERRVAQEPGVIAVTFADYVPGTVPRTQVAEVQAAPGARPASDDLFGHRRWGLDSSRHLIAQSSPGVPSTRATGVPLRERSSSTRRSCAAFSAMREAHRRSALACGIASPWHQRARQQRSSGSRSSASRATSAWIP